MAGNISQRTEDFAIKIVQLYKELMIEQEFIMSKQLLRCGTSIGANIAEADYAQSKADFISKSSIALKEASESRYWLKILYKTGYLNFDTFHEFQNEITVIIKLLAKIVKTAKGNIN